MIMMESHGTKMIGRDISKYIPAFSTLPELQRASANTTSSGRGPCLGSLGIFAVDFFLDRQPKY